MITDTFAVGAAGGAFVSSARGNPAEGVTLLVPEKAIELNVRLSLGYSKDLPAIRAGEPSGVVIVTETDREVTWEKPLRISVPFVPNSRYRGVVGYRVDSQGKIRPVDIVDVDLKAGRAVFATYQPGRLTWVYLVR